MRRALEPLFRWAAEVEPVAGGRGGGWRQKEQDEGRSPSSLSLGPGASTASDAGGGILPLLVEGQLQRLFWRLMVFILRNVPRRPPSVFSTIF